ncbi:MAG: sulfotransferase [Planctomycetes bacterium]|jgi:hypothetical protein|nr:sulfotransferase [Planctomycetota bacterium]
MTAAIDRPIFIVGPHRSGTTLLLKILADHPAAGWLDRMNHRFPASPRFAALLARLLGGDGPKECQHFWDYRWKGADDFMGPDQAGPGVARWYRRRVARVLAQRHASRFVAKYPRLSLRLPWLDAVFPGCIFLHMVRDWRAVVNSTVERKLKRNRREGGWFGVRIPGYREMGDLPPEISSGRIYRLVTHELETQAPRYPGRFFRASYEEICAEPVASLRRLAGQCGLPFTPDFEAKVPKTLKSANHKWKERLTPDAVERIRAEDPELFSRYEFT